MKGDSALKQVINAYDYLISDAGKKLIQRIKIKKMMHNSIYISSATEKNELLGLKNGKILRKEEEVKKLFKINKNIENIERVTGLSKIEIKKILNIF